MPPSVAVVVRGSPRARTGSRRLLRLAALAGLAWPSGSVDAQQVPDRGFVPPIAVATFPPGQGPEVGIDAAHVNFHTMEGRYASFADLLERDGYRVRSSGAAFTADVLERVDILVVANAMHPQSEGGFAPLPNLSAFAEAEILALERWVAAGGSLLLIADHMPIAGHTEDLAAAFGIRFHNGFVLGADGDGSITFRRSDGTLAPGDVVDGRDGSERVDSVTAFTGQAFRLDPAVDGEPLLIIPEGYTLFLPSEAWEFSDSTPRIPAAYLLQGALVRHGRGKVAVFGEAAMFSAQLSGPGQRPMGMNHPSAAQNYRFALNVMRWLATEVR